MSTKQSCFAHCREEKLGMAWEKKNPRKGLLGSKPSAKSECLNYIQNTKKEDFREWERGSAVKNTGCPCRGPIRDSQPFLTPVLGSIFLWSLGHLHGTHKYTQHTHKIALL